MRKFLSIATFSAFMLGAAAPALSDEIITKITDIYTTQKAMPDTITVDFSAFDLNQDGELSRDEVGEKLFRIFDTDGNGVIDNIEFERPLVMTVIPMERKTVISTDFGADGEPGRVETSTEDFYKRSMLAKFDKDGSGLSARLFLERTFWSLDDNRDRVIDLREWKTAYNAAIRPSANHNRYNR